MEFRRNRYSKIPGGAASRWRLQAVVLLVLAVVCAGAVLGCDPGDGGNGDTETTLRSPSGPDEGDIVGTVGEDIEVEEAVVTVRALEVAFQPAMPTERLSDETPTAPDTGEGFYQAYVRVENNGLTPLRVDPEDFVCAVGTVVASIEPTRTGPLARSLIEGTSLDLLLTFKAPTGFEPVLLYSPPWYDGVIRVSPESQVEPTTTTEG